VRRITVALLSTISSLVLLFAYPTSHNAAVATGGSTGSGTGSGTGTGTGSGSAADPTTGASSGASSGTSGSTAAKTYTGAAVDTRWGTVQVRITVANGKVTRSQAVQYPNDNGHDQEINAYALPVLAQEAVAAQSASIDAVSGATVTSNGYIESLQSALDAAHL